MANNMPKRPEILAQWARASIPTEWSATPPERRVGLVDAIAAAMARAPAARSTGRVSTWVLAAAAAAALVTLSVVGWRARQQSEPVAGQLVALFGPASTVVHGREVTSVLPSSGALSLAFDSAVETGRESSSRVDLASGVAILVGSDTHLSLPHAKDRANREELELDGGSVRIQVPKLRFGHFFAVHTPDTQVTVHGTSFSVEVSKPSSDHPLSTRVCVTEGVVTVQKLDAPEVLLTAGMQWDSAPIDSSSAGVSSTCTAPDPRSVVKAELELRAASRSPREIGDTRPAPSEGVSRRPVPHTALAEQNRLFAQAMTAREQGDGAGAVRMLDSFVRRYPTSPLAEDAHVELFRALARLRDSAGAARAARQYLALYGDGFARDEARELALDPGPSP